MKMEITISALWLVWAFVMCISTIAVYQLVGSTLMVQFFPEGNRWWLPYARATSLIIFAIVTLMHP
jgi:cytochrome c biogenesis protein CcdA